MDYEQFWNRYISIFLEVGDDITFLLKLNSLCNPTKLIFSHASASSPFPVDIDKINAAVIKNFNYAKVFGERKELSEYPVKADLGNYFNPTIGIYQESHEILSDPRIAFSQEAKQQVSESLDRLAHAIRSIRTLLSDVEKENNIRLDEWDFIKNPQAEFPSMKVARHHYDPAEIGKHEFVSYGEDNLTFDAARINSMYKRFSRLERDRTCPQI